MLMEVYRYFVAMAMVLTLYNVHKVHGNNNKVCTPLTRIRGPHAQGLCGNSLPIMLDMVCQNGFNSRGKREIAKVKKLLPLEGVSLNKEDATSYLVSKKTNYADTGIVCECCYHSCSISELSTYCLSPYKKRADQIMKRTQIQESEEKQQQK